MVEGGMWGVVRGESHQLTHKHDFVYKATQLAAIGL